MTVGGTEDIEILSDGLATGIEELLSQAIVSPEATSDAASYMLGFDAEAKTPAATIRRAIDVIGALADEHGARIADCDVSGVQKTDDGYRLWGTIECVPGQRGPDVSTRVDDVSVEELDNGRWRLRMKGEGV